MREVLYPRTDAGVAFQSIAVLAIVLLGLVAARRHREVQTLVVGMGLCVAGLFGLRMLH